MRRSRLAVVSVFAALAMPSGADAGEYTVYSCRGPDGTPNGIVSEGGGGWRVTESVEPYGGVYVGCGRGNGITAVIDEVSASAPGPRGRRLTLSFEAAAATVITRYTIDWSGSFTNGGTTRDAWLNRGAVTDGLYADHFHPGEQWSERLSERDFADASVLAGIGCPTRATICDVGAQGSFTIASAVFGLRDVSPPVGAASGDATTATTWTGEEAFAYQAADQGGGVYRVLTLVDGNVRSAQIAAANDGHCADATPADADPYVFLSPRPCQPTAAGTAVARVAGVPNGTHEVAIAVEDAAGNRTTIFGPVKRFIVGDAAAAGYFLNGHFVNPRFSLDARQPNGAPATLDATLSGALQRRRGRRTVALTRMQVAFGARALIRGALRTKSGAPIADATLFIAERNEDGDWRIRRSVKTSARGGYSLRLAAGAPSRTVRILYFPYSDAQDVVSSRDLALRVRAGVILHAPPVVSGRVRFTGRVLGVLASRGAIVSLQAKIGNSYRTFRQLRARPPRGAFSATYRFRTRGGRFQFRAVVARQAGLAHDAGRSRTVTVRVR